MKPKRIAVALPASLAADIDQLVGKGNRSAFAMEIVEREVNRLKLLRELSKSAVGRKKQD